MKRSLLIIYCLLFVICILRSSAFAAQTSSNIAVTVLVQGSFNLMVDTNSFDFARLEPGQTGEMNRADGVAVAGTSSSGNPWYLSVTAAPLSSGVSSIPNNNFTWSSTSEGDGSWNGLQEKSFSDADHNAYVSSVDEADSASRIVNKFKFRLHVPEDTKPGTYTTTVMFTMTE